MKQHADSRNVPAYDGGLAKTGRAKRLKIPCVLKRPARARMVRASA